MRKFRGRLSKLLLLTLVVTGLLSISLRFNTDEVQAVGGQGASRASLCSGSAGPGGSGSAQVLGWGVKFALVDDSCFVNWKNHQIRGRNLTYSAYNFLPSVYVLFDKNNKFIDIEQKNFYIPACDKVVSEKGEVNKSGIHDSFRLGQIPISKSTRKQFDKIFSSANSSFTLSKFENAVKKNGGVFKGEGNGMNLPILSNFLNKYFATKKDGTQDKNFLFEQGSGYTYGAFKSWADNKQELNKLKASSGRYQFASHFFDFLKNNNSVGRLGSNGIKDMYSAYFEPFAHYRSDFDKVDELAQDWAWDTRDYDQSYEDTFLYGSLLVQPVILLGQSTKNCCAVTWDQYLLANYYYNRFHDCGTTVESYSGKRPNSENLTNNATESLALFERYTGGHNVLIDRATGGASTWSGAAKECSERGSYGLGGVDKDGKPVPISKCVGNNNPTSDQKKNKQIRHDKKKPVSWGKMDKYRTVMNTKGALDNESKSAKSVTNYYMLGYCTFGGYTYSNSSPSEQEEVAHVNLAVTAKYNQLGQYNVSYDTNLVSAQRTTEDTERDAKVGEYDEYTDLNTKKLKDKNKVKISSARYVHSDGSSNNPSLFRDTTEYKYIHGVRYKLPESVCQKVTKNRIWKNYTWKDSNPTFSLVRNNLQSSGEGKFVAGGYYSTEFSGLGNIKSEACVSKIASTLFNGGTQIGGDINLGSGSPSSKISDIASNLVSPGLKESCNIERQNNKSGSIKSATQGADAEDDEDDEKSTEVNDSNIGYSAELFVQDKEYETGVTSATLVYDEDGNLIGVNYNKSTGELTVDSNASYTDDTTHTTYNPDSGARGAVGTKSIFENYCNVASISNGNYSGLLYDRDKLNKAGKMKRCYIIAVPRGNESRKITNDDKNADLWKNLFIEAYNCSAQNGKNSDWKIIAPGTEADNPISNWVKSITGGATDYEFSTSLQPPVIHSGVCIKDLGAGKNDQGYDWYILNIVIPKLINVSSEVNLLDYQLNYLYPTTFMEDKNRAEDKKHYQRNVSFSREVIIGSSEGTYNDGGTSKGHSFYTHNIDNVHEPGSKNADGTDKVVKESGKTVANSGKSLLLPVRADVNSGGTVSADGRVGHEFTTRSNVTASLLGKNNTDGTAFSDEEYSGAYGFNLARGVYGDKRTLSKISQDEVMPASDNSYYTLSTMKPSPFLAEQLEHLGLSVGTKPANTEYRVISGGTGLDETAWKTHELFSSGSDTVYADGTGKYADKYKTYWDGADAWSKTSLDVLLYGSSYKTEKLDVNSKAYWANNKNHWYKNRSSCDNHGSHDGDNHICYEWSGHWVASRGANVDGSSIHYYDGRPLKLLVHQIPVYVVKDNIKSTIYKYYTHDTPVATDKVKYMDRYRTYYLGETKVGYNNGNCVVGSNKNIVNLDTAKINGGSEPYRNFDGTRTSAKKKSVSGNSAGSLTLHSGDLEQAVPSSGMDKESELNKVSYSKAVAVENGNFGTASTGYKFTPAQVEYYPEVAMKLYAHAGSDASGSYFSNSLFHELNETGGGYLSYSIKTIGEAKRKTNLSSLYITRVHSSDIDGGRKNATGIIYSDTMGAGTNAGNASTDNKAVIYGGSDITINADTNFELRLYAYSLDLIGSDTGDTSATYADGRKYTDIINGENVNVYQEWGNTSDDSNTSNVLLNNFRSWADNVRKSMYADVTLKVSGGSSEKTFNNFNVSIGQIGGVNNDDILKDEKRYSIKVKNGNIVKDEAYEILLKDIAADYGYNEDKQDTGDGVSWSASDARKNAEALFTKSDIWQTIYRSCETSRSNFNKSQEMESESGGMNKKELDAVRKMVALPGALANYSDNSGLTEWWKGKWYDEEVKTFVIRRFATGNIAPKHIILSDKLDYGLTPDSNAGQNNDSNAQQDSYSTYDGKWYLTLYFRDNLATNADINIYNESTALYRPETGLPNAGYNKDAVKGGNVLINELHLDGADFLIPSATTNEMNW